MNKEEFDNENVHSQYRDPITGEYKTVVLCPQHTRRMMRILRSVSIGSSSTAAPHLASCDACRNYTANSTTVVSPVDRSKMVLDKLESWVMDPIDTDPTRQTLAVWIRKTREELDRGVAAD